MFLFGKNKNEQGGRKKKQPQKRGAYRAPFEFQVRYAISANRFKRTAKAFDLSTGGLRLVTIEELPVGSDIELTFTLPNSVLEVLEADKTEVEVGVFGNRVVTKKDRQRPFDEMKVKGRIVSLIEKHQYYAYGIKFMEIEPFFVEEIQRFIHASQLVRIRTQKQKESDV